VGVVLSPDGSSAYVADQNGNGLTVINTGTFATAQIRLPFFGYPTALAITPDGKSVYVTVDNIKPDFGQAICYTFVIDTSRNAVAHTIITPYPVGVAISPDGAKAYVVSGAGGATSLLTISTASNRITGALQLDNFGPFDITTAGIVATPDGTRIFADSSQTATVYEIDAQQDKILKAIPVGTLPGQLAMTADGSQVWVADYMATSISAVDVASATVAKIVPLGNPSYGVAITPK
jgi:DNA-binding beta-propeller fold protein YncE